MLDRCARAEAILCVSEGPFANRLASRTSWAAPGTLFSIERTFGLALTLTCSTCVECRSRALRQGTTSAFATASLVRLPRLPRGLPAPSRRPEVRPGAVVILLVPAQHIPQMPLVIATATPLGDVSPSSVRGRSTFGSRYIITISSHLCNVHHKPAPVHDERGTPDRASLLRSRPEDALGCPHTKTRRPWLRSASENCSSGTLTKRS